MIILQELTIRFEHLSSPEQKYIVESMSGGVALIDYDRDGKADIAVVRYVDFRYDSVPRPGDGAGRSRGPGKRMTPAATATSAPARRREREAARPSSADHAPSTRAPSHAPLQRTTTQLTTEYAT